MENKNQVEFSPGDIVEIRPDILEKRRKRGSFTPTDLWAIGWPNRFQVLAQTKDKEGAPTLTLDPCCRWMINRATGLHLCVAHPAEWFRHPKKQETRTEIRPDRQLIIETPMGDKFQIDYQEDDESPGMSIQVGAGRPLILGGKVSQFLAEKLKDAGFL